MFSVGAYSQSAPKLGDVDSAYVNAKKGIVWGLSNIKVKKMRMENRLIADNQLIAQVKIEKEINGIKIISTGIAGTTEVSITAYRTFSSLVTEGFLDKNSTLLKEEE